MLGDVYHGVISVVPLICRVQNPYIHMVGLVVHNIFVSITFSSLILYISNNIYTENQINYHL